MTAKAAPERRNRNEILVEKIEAAIGDAQKALAELKARVTGENPVGRVIQTWALGWRGKYHRAWDFSAAEKGNIERLVRVHGHGEVLARLQRFLDDDDRQIVAALHPLSWFVTRWNQYGVPADVGAVEDGPTGEAPVDCQHTPRCKTDAAHTRRRRHERNGTR